MNLKIIYTEKCKKRDGMAGAGGVPVSKLLQQFVLQGDDLDSGNGNEKVIV